MRPRCPTTAALVKGAAMRDAVCYGSPAEAGSSTRCRSAPRHGTLLQGRGRDPQMSNSADADEQRNQDAMPSDDELQEPRVAKKPGDEPTGDEPLDPGPDHERSGIGVLDGRQAEQTDCRTWKRRAVQGSWGGGRTNEK